MLEVYWAYRRGGVEDIAKHARLGIICPMCLLLTRGQPCPTVWPWKFFRRAKAQASSLLCPAYGLNSFGWCWGCQIDDGECSTRHTSEPGFVWAIWVLPGSFFSQDIDLKAYLGWGWWRTVGLERSTQGGEGLNHGTGFGRFHLDLTYASLLGGLRGSEY